MLSMKKIAQFLCLRSEDNKTSTYPSEPRVPELSAFALEPRIMFDAAGAATGGEILTEIPDPVEAGQPTETMNEPADNPQTEAESLFQGYVPPGENPKEIVFIDPEVPDYESLIRGLRTGIDVIMLSEDGDGVDQISEVLAEYSGLDTVHILSHGQSGSLSLGGTPLTGDNLDQYAEQITGWSSAMSDQADLLLYGCDVSAGEYGADFIERLSALTRSDVAASNDDTGAALQGGDWDLESTTGLIESDLAFSEDTMFNYDFVLNHFRYGTLSWAPTGDGREILLKMQIGWTNDHGHISQSLAVGDTVSGRVPGFSWGDSSSDTLWLKVISRDATSNEVDPIARTIFRKN